MIKVGKIIFSMLLSGLMLFSIFAYAPEMYAANQYVFKIAFSSTADLKMGNEKLPHYGYLECKVFKESVEKETKGKMKVKIYMNSVLGDHKSALEQILAGTIQASSPPDGSVASFYKDIQILSIPYLFKDAQQLFAILDGKFGKKLYNDMAKKSGFRVLCTHVAGGFRSFSNNKRLVKTAADMKGLKIRSMNSPVQIEMIKALGASATPVAFVETYSALQTGVVDGQENSAQTMFSASLQEVQKYYTLDKHLPSTAFLVTSERYFKSLPNNIRKALVRAGQKAQKAARDQSAYVESIALKKMKEACTVYTPTPAERDTFRKRCQAPCIKWIKENIDRPQLVDEVLKLVNKQ
jgi:tripartite ATP-independent transporter DctP family solute receptor